MKNRQIFLSACAIFVFAILFLDLTGAVSTSSLQLTDEFIPSLVSLFLVVSGAVLFFVFIYTIFSRVIKEMDDRKYRIYWWVIFFLSLIFCLILVSSIVIVPRNDSHTLIDSALIMNNMKTGVVPDNIMYSDYLSKYPNNYLLLWIFYHYFHIFGVTGGITAYRFAYIFNVACIYLGIFLGCKSLRIVYGKKASLRALILFVINPVLYLAAFWVYSNTISFPLMLGIIYLCIRITQTQGIRRYVLIVLNLVISIVAYGIRPTAVFPLIAFLVYFALKLLRNVSERISEKLSGKFSAKNGGVKSKNPLTDRNFAVKVLKMTALTVLALAIVLLTRTAVNKASDSVTNLDEADSYPVMHWIMMGSHNDGEYNEEDDYLTFHTENEDRTKVCLANVLDNYKEKGIIETINFWVGKSQTVFSYGNFDIQKRIEQVYEYSPFYKYLYGACASPFVVMANLYWIIILLLTVIYIANIIISGKFNSTNSMLIITLLGGIVFYFLWEVKPEYGIPFIPVFVMLAALAFENENVMFEKIKAKGILEKTATKAVVLAVTVALLAVGNIYIFNRISNTTKNREYAIRSNAKSWSKDIEMKDGDVLNQSFYPNIKFNYIELMTINEVVESGDYYDVTIYDSNDNTLYFGRIFNNDFGSTGKAKIYVDDIEGVKDRAIRVCISYHCVDGNGAKLCLKDDMYLDTYKGNLYLNDEDMESDLVMSVYYEYD